MSEINPDWQNVRILEPRLEKVQKWKVALFTARDVKSQLLYAVFNVKPPSAEVLAKRKEKTMGKPITIAQNYDKSQVRKLKSLIKYGVVQFKTVEERIETSHQYRSVLANYIINANSFYNPAQYLLSKYCLLALQVSRRLGEKPYPVMLPPYVPNEFED